MMMPTKAFMLLVLSCILACGSSGVAGSSSNVAPDIEVGQVQVESQKKSTTSGSARGSSPAEESSVLSTIEQFKDLLTPEVTQILRSHWSENLDRTRGIDEQRDHLHRHRILQPSQQGPNYEIKRHCGQLISYIDIEQAKSIADLFLNVILPSDLLNNPSLENLAKSVIFNLLQNGVATYKVCMSCREVIEKGDATFLDGLTFDSSDTLQGFLSYCNSNSHAYDVVSFYE